MKKISDTLRAMAEMHGRQLSTFAAEMIARDLSVFQENEVLKALSKCRAELNRFPTVADIISQIPDGHPGIEEAWSLLPKREDDSCVWTEEMQEVHQDIYKLIQEDIIAARMAFKEIYPKVLSRSRSEGKKVKWSVTLGNDKTGHEKALLGAIEKNRISFDEANKLKPELFYTERALALGERKNGNVTHISEIVKGLLPDGSSKSDTTVPVSDVSS